MLMQQPRGCFRLCYKPFESSILPLVCCLFSESFFFFDQGRTTAAYSDSHGYTYIYVGIRTYTYIQGEVRLFFLQLGGDGLPVGALFFISDLFTSKLHGTSWLCVHPKSWWHPELETL